MEQFMMKLMYDLPSDDLAETVTITKAFIKGEGEAVITRRVPAIPASTEDVIPVDSPLNTVLPLEEA
jgi:ATP-dependent protease Clp ATPase subunit